MTEPKIGWIKRTKLAVADAARVSRPPPRDDDACCQTIPIDDDDAWGQPKQDEAV